jgi:NAD(P)-dependent dehydrogenase (short-subunit alcohol dehydrogenase family)
LWETTEADFDRVIDVNLKVPFFTVTQARPLLAEPNAPALDVERALQQTLRSTARQPARPPTGYG